MKRILVILLLCFMAVSLFACGDTEAPTETAGEEEASVTEESTSSNETNAEETTLEETTLEETTLEETTLPETTAAEETTVEETTNEETTTVEETSITEETTTESETERVEKNNPSSVGIFDKYDLDAYMSPIWENKIVHNETVMFVGMDDKAPLLYTPDKIISVRSYDLSIEYTEGVDYKLEDGRLVLLERTRIPVCPIETYYSVHNDKPYLSTMYNGQITQTMYGEGDTMCRWQVAVTYKHSDEWEGVDVGSYRETYADFIKKLENGQDVTVFFYGDSITTGANASGCIGVEPYAPAWAQMFCQYVAKQYGYTVKYIDSYSDSYLTAGKPAGGTKRDDSVFGTNGTITYINTAVGGWSTQQGRDNFDTYVKRYVQTYGCDLFVLAFGMNNGGSTANDVCQVLRDIVSKTVLCAPEADIVMVSTMIPNPEAVRNPQDTYFCNGNQSTFESEMYVLKDALKNNFSVDCEIAPMTSISAYIHSQKRFRDTTGNNVNHPSDFIVRAYAQSIYQTVFGYENQKDNTQKLEGAPVVGANYNAMIETPGANVYLDGVADTTNANNAVCVRLESTSGGYFMYHITNGANVYIGIGGDGNIEYSNDAKSVWTYNETARAMVCSDSNAIEIKLAAPEICLHSVIIVGEKTHQRVGCARCGILEVTESHEISEYIIKNSDGSTEYRSRCSACGHTVSSYTVPSGINTYISALEINNKSNVSSRINYSEIITDADGAYARIHGGAEVNYNEVLIYSNSSASEVTGQYFVIKYRVGENQRGQQNVILFAGTNNNVPTNGQEQITLNGMGTGVEDGLWHTAIIDMSTITSGGFVADGNGEFRTKFIAIRPLFINVETGDDENDYMDIAFAAVCDSLEKAELLVDGATYEYYATSSVPSIKTAD